MPEPVPVPGPIPHSSCLLQGPQVPPLQTGLAAFFVAQKVAGWPVQLTHCLRDDVLVTSQYGLPATPVQLLSCSQALQRLLTQYGMPGRALQSLGVMQSMQLLVAVLQVSKPSALAAALAAQSEGCRQPTQVRVSGLQTRSRGSPGWAAAQ